MGVSGNAGIIQESTQRGRAKQQSGVGGPVRQQHSATIPPAGQLLLCFPSNKQDVPCAPASKLFRQPRLTGPWVPLSCMCSVCVKFGASSSVVMLRSRKALKTPICCLRVCRIAVAPFVSYFIDMTASTWAGKASPCPLIFSCTPSTWAPPGDIGHVPALSGSWEHVRMSCLYLQASEFS
jgi:hypothetical protein